MLAAKEFLLLRPREKSACTLPLQKVKKLGYLETIQMEPAAIEGAGSGLAMKPGTEYDHAESKTIDKSQGSRECDVSAIEEIEDNTLSLNINLDRSALKSQTN